MVELQQKRIGANILETLRRRAINLRGTPHLVGPNEVRVFGVLVRIRSFGRRTHPCRRSPSLSLLLLPHYVTNMLVSSVVARPLEGEPPTIDLVMGYNKSNTSPLLKRFLLRADELVAGVQRQNEKTEVNGTASKRGVVKGR